MLTLQLPTVLFPISRILTSYLPRALTSSTSRTSTAGKRIGEGRNLEWFSSASPVPKFRLEAGSVSSAESGINEENSVVELRLEAMPKHVAIIIDGHAKWARSRGVTIQHGHKTGSIKLKDVVSHSSKLGIKLLSIYVFSTENWKRPKMEVDFLMRTIEESLRSDVKELITRLDLRFSVIGNKSRLSESLRNTINCIEEVSEANKGMHLILALSYGGRNDIVEATKTIATKVEHGTLRAADVDETMFEQHLMTNVGEFPNPDLLIKTGGELRVSNFFLWQLAYTELYFTDKLFPDFGEADLLEALASYQRRERRFGKRLSAGNSSV